MDAETVELFDALDRTGLTAGDRRELLVRLREAVDEELTLAEADVAAFTDAAHALHEQAHGSAPWRFCQQSPCGDLDVPADAGPAPTSRQAARRAWSA